MPPHILYFNALEVQRLYEHAKAAKRHTMSMAERAAIYGEDKCGHAQPGEESKATPSLVLVRDHGVYFMSSGLPPLPSNEGAERSFVAYAAGFNPAEDSLEAVDEDARAMFGSGDDFSVRFPVTHFDEAMNGRPALAIQVRVDGDHFTLGWARPPAAPNAAPEDDGGPSP